MRIIMTVLLAILVAGTATYAVDAYAQTNSQRIADIHEETDGLADAVKGISDAITSLPESLQASVDSMAASLAPLSDQISTLTQSSARVESAITEFGPVLTNLAASVQQNSDTLADLSGIMASMNSDIVSIRSAVSDQGSSDLVKSINALTTKVDNNEITISQRLDNIEAAITSLEAKMGSAPPTTTLPPTGITRSTASVDISSYTYQQGVKRTAGGNDIYTISMTFSCTGPVSIDTVSTDLTTADRWILPTATPHSGTNENYLRVDGRELYNSKFESAPGIFHVYNRAENYNLQALPTGSSLGFESQQYEHNNRIKDAASNANDGYTITVSYLGDRSTTCSFTGIGSGPNTGPLSKSDTVTLTTTLPSSDLFSSFSLGVTCGNDPVEITGFQMALTESWNTGLAQFAEFKVTTATTSAMTDIGFNSAGTINTGSYPISFSGEDIRVDGKLPYNSDNAAQVLLIMAYNTVENGECTQKTS